jgi:competence protein ComEC
MQIIKKLIIILTIYLLLLTTRIYFQNHRPQSEILNTSISKETVVRGIIIKDLDKREKSQYMIVAPVAPVDGNNKLEKLSFERIKVTTGLTDKYAYGDLVSLEGTLELPSNFETDSGREFDYVSYLKVEDIVYVMDYPFITLESRGNGSSFISLLYKIKHYFLKKINQSISEPYSNLAAGMLIGEKNALSKASQEDFRKSGLIHVVVLSGYNVTIVAESIIKIFSFLPVTFARVCGGLGIISFALLTGAGATVLRASIMALLVLFARFIGREYDVLRALFMTCALMTLHNPKIILHDQSFRLSAMATFALISFTPFFEKRLKFITERFGLRATVASTLATQAFVTPVLIYMSGMVSLISLVTNCLVVCMVPLTMLLSFLGAGFSMISPFLGKVAGLGALMLLKYIFLIVDISIKVPYATVTVPMVSGYVIFALYVVFLAIYSGKLLWKNSLQSPPS